ncbi:hypothetical protein [Loktanella salsilacus]|uniref:hypothetical protein n=1 Tax=Loktanella salsilacus TaxID=195913 RepID=UPI0037365EF8
MQLPVEIQHAEILDWWESEHERISDALADRLPGLYYLVDQQIEEMPFTNLVRRGKFKVEHVEPIVAAWMDKIYLEFTLELDESLRASLHSLEGDKPGEGWSFKEMAVAGAALAVSASPVAAIPFFAGGLTTAGITFLGVTVGGGVLLATPVAALAGSAVLAALGPTARTKAIANLKSRLRSAIHAAIEVRVLGDADGQAHASLKGRLLSELYSVAAKRLALIE